jgi:HK97 family phage portal protein
MPLISYQWPFNGALTRWFRGMWVSRLSQQSGPQGVPITAQSDSGPAVNTDTALSISAVWACVMLLAETLSTLPLFVYRYDAKRNRELAYEHPLHALLHDRPNSYMTAPVFFASMCINYVLRHNAYAKIIRSPYDASAVALWPLATDQVQASVVPGAGLVYAYEIDGNVDIIAQQNMLHWRGVGNGITGLDPLLHQADTLGGAIQQAKASRKIFNRGNKLSGFLSIDRVLTAEQRAAIKQNFIDMRENPDQTLHVLEAGMKFDPMQMTGQEAQQTESLRFSVEDIARVFGVPSVLINDVTKNTSWGSGIEQIVEGFTKFKLRPMLKFLEAEIKHSVLTPRERAQFDVEFSFDGLLRASVGPRYEAYQKALSGISTPNEIRQLENLPRIEGGDTLFVPANMVSIERANTQPLERMPNANQAAIA